MFKIDSFLSANLNQQFVFQKHGNVLSPDELTTIRENLLRSNVTVDVDFIKDVWHPVYRRHFLKQSLARAYDCRRGYYIYHEGLDVSPNVSIALQINHVNNVYCWFVVCYTICHSIKCQNVFHHKNHFVKCETHSLEEKNRFKILY